MTTFAEFLLILKNADDELESDINWEEVLGDVRDKVDSIKFVHDRLNFEIEFLKKQEESLERRRLIIEKNLKNLKKYVNWSMFSLDFQAVPGNEWAIVRRNNPVKIECNTNPTVELWTKYDKYIKRKVEYSWSKDQLKKDFETLPDELKNHCSKVQETRVQFIPRERL